MSSPGFGINCSLNANTNKEQIDSMIHHLLDLGVSWIRREFDFFITITLGEDVQHYLFAQCKKHNIQILGVLSGIVPGTLQNLINPLWAYKPVTTLFDEFQLFIKKTVTTHQTQITHRQIWNEPNTKRFRIQTPNPHEYVKLVLESTNTIKQIEPQALIVCGGIFYDPSQWFLPNYNAAFIKECNILGLEDVIDIYTIHPYSLSCYLGYQGPTKLITTTMNNIQQRKKDSQIPQEKHIRVTEFGISKQRTYYKAHEIAHIYKSLYQQLQLQDIPFFLRNICDFQDKRHGRGNPEKSFGLLTPTYQPTPIYTEIIQLGRH